MSYVTAKPHVPKLFKEIMISDRTIAALKSCSLIPFRETADLIKERREFSRAAEKALRWNTDKGNTAQ